MATKRRSASIEVSELKRRIPDVAGVARDIYSMELRDGKGRCPFSQKHAHGDRDPSLRYDRRKKRLFCASQNCLGAKGVDAIGLVEIMDQCDFPTAIQRLKDHYSAGLGTETSHSKRQFSPTATSSAPDIFDGQSIIRAENVRRDLELSGFLEAGEYRHGPDLRKIRFEHKFAKQANKKRPERPFGGSIGSMECGIPATAAFRSRFM